MPRKYAWTLFVMIPVGLMISACELSSYRKTDVKPVGDQDLETMHGFFGEDFRNQQDVRFHVQYSAMSGYWACVSVEPLIKNQFKAEPRWALFKKENGVWVRKDWSEGMTFENDFELIDLPERNSRVAKLIVKKYPDCPMELFPPGK